jgi:hypothetical protein
VTTRKRLLAALEGGTPEQTPLSIYDWNMERAITPADVAERMARPDWSRLLDQGLGICHHCEILEAIEHGVETTVEERSDGGDALRIERK